MKLRYRGFVNSELSPFGELTASFGASEQRLSEKHLLAYTPAARLNPYQSLIYKSFDNHGFVTAPILDPSRFNYLLESPNLTATRSLHLHWNAWMTQGAEDAPRARALAMGMVGRLRRLRSSGINVIWTVHNVYPHDARHIDVELEVQQGIADTANVIHVMSKGTVESLNGITSLDPHKLIVSPHPSYRGAYADIVSRSDARAALGIRGDEIVLILFGAIKEYKGLERSLDVLDLLIERKRDTRFRLIVAGKADDSLAAQTFVNRALTHPNVLIDNSSIPNDKVQFFMRAADVGLLNYSRSLNSGAALLYGTFDLPVVASDTPTFREGLLASTTAFVSGPSVEDFYEAIDNILPKLGSQDLVRAIRNHHERLGADVVSADFAEQLHEKIR